MNKYFVDPSKLLAFNNVDIHSFPEYSPMGLNQC